MKVEREKNEVRLTLTKEEARLLELALARASFQDTPVSQQSAIQAFCELAMETLARRS